MSDYNHLINQVYNRLTVLRVWREDGKTLCKCECSCDKETIIITRLDGVKSGHTKSCGCYNIEKIKSRRGIYHPNYKHGSNKENYLYRLWGTYK